MKKQFITPYIRIIPLDATEIIATSNGDEVKIDAAPQSETKQNYFTTGYQNIW